MVRFQVLTATDVMMAICKTSIYQLHNVMSQKTGIFILYNDFKRFQYFLTQLPVAFKVASRHIGSVYNWKLHYMQVGL